MLRQAFNRWGQVLLHFGTSLPWRIPRDDLMPKSIEIGGRLKNLVYWLDQLWDRTSLT